MKTIRCAYNTNGIENINNKSSPDFPILGTVTIQYQKRTKDFDAGLYCGLAVHCICLCDGVPKEIEDFTESDYWNFDTHLVDIIDHKRCIVCFESLEDYGVLVCTNNIIEFITGVASCPTRLQNLNSTAQDWRTLRYLDTRTIDRNNIPDEPFNLCAEDLPINFYPHFNAGLCAIKDKTFCVAKCFITCATIVVLQLFT